MASLTLDPAPAALPFDAGSGVNDGLSTTASGQKVTIAVFPLGESIVTGRDTTRHMASRLIHDMILQTSAQSQRTATTPMVPTASWLWPSLRISLVIPTGRSEFTARSRAPSSRRRLLAGSG